MGVFTRHDSPYWQLYLETIRVKEPTKILIGTTQAQKTDSRRQAEALYHQRMSELSARLYKLPAALAAIRFERYATEYESVVKLRKGARRELEIQKNLVKFFGNDLLTTIDRARAQDYMLYRQRNKIAPRTINREIAHLKGMLRDAVPKYLSASPLVGMKHLKAPSPRRRLMTPAEERRILKVADPQDKALIILGQDTLIRMGDLLDLERADRHDRLLSVRDPKNGEPYEVVLSDRAAAALDKLGKAGTYYFEKFRRAENPRDWSGSVRYRLEWLCTHAKPKVPYGKKIGGITFHWATRRTGATRMVVKDKVPIPVVQRQGGWKNPDVLLAIYAEADRSDQLAAFAPPSRKRRKRA